MNIITIILLILLAAICFIFWIRSKVTALIALGIRIGFVFFFLLALIGIVFQEPFNLAADFTLKQFGTYDKIQEIDNVLPVNDLKDFSGNILDRLSDLFGGGNNEEEESSQAGFFEENIYQSFVEVLAFIYRILTLVISFAVLIALVYVSFITSHITEIERLKAQNSQLNMRVAALEKNLNLQVQPQTLPPVH